MATKKEYNGWFNYETWNAALWIGESGVDTDELAREFLSNAIDNDCDAGNVHEVAIHQLAEYLESEHDDNMPEVSGVYADLLNAASREIEWRDIAKHYVDDVPLFSAGWNMPGYMPDEAPAVFLEADDAREYIADAMERFADEAHCDDDVDVNGADGSTAEEIAALREAADTVRAGSGEFGATIAGYHYFVSQI